MHAIKTKYLSATNTLGARIRATGNGVSTAISYPHELSGMACHAAAAKALAQKMNWKGELLGGQLGLGEYVFVFDHASSKAA
jgi:hypothetical protein